MSNNKIKTIIIFAILSLCFLGIIVKGKEGIKSVVSFDKKEISELMGILSEKAPAGTEITLEIDNSDIPEETYRRGQDINAKSNKNYLRGLSWFGLGATEAAVKDQGFIINNDKINFGQNKGY